VPSDAATGSKLLPGFVETGLIFIYLQKLMSRFRSVGFKYSLKKLLHFPDRLSHGFDSFKIENLS
jgi:hypothetical protein